MTDANFRRKRRGRILSRLLVVVAGLGLIGLCIAALKTDPVPPMPRINFTRSWAAARRFEEPDSARTRAVVIAESLSKRV